MMQPDHLINSINIIDIFSELNNQYETLGGKKAINIIVVGGAAIAMNFTFRRSTLDIDAGCQNNEIFE